MKGNLEATIRRMLQQIEELQESGPWQESLSAVRDGLRRCLDDLKATEKDIAKMNKAVETTPTAIALISLEGQIEYANPGLLKSGGFCDAREVLGRSVYDYTDEEGRGKLEDEIIPALFSAGQWRGELPLRRKDGKSYIAEMICALVEDDSGEPSYFLANFYDITDRKYVEESLLLDDSRLEALLKLNQMDDASLQEIADFALEAGVKLTNSVLGYLAFVDEEEKTLMMHSWSRRAMQECNIDHKKTIYPLEETGLWGDALRRRQAVITNDYPASPKRRGIPHGHVKILRHMNVPVMDKGRIVVVAGVGNKENEYDNADVRQLTLLMSGMWKLIQRRKTEEALKESQRALSTLMSNLPGMAYRCKNDRLWTMEFVSDGCLELTGYRPDDLIQNRAVSYAQIIHPDDLDYIWNEVQEAVAERRPYRLTYRIRSLSGTKWVWEQGQGIFAPQGDLIALEGFVNDITERKLAEEALKKAHEELEKRVQERTAWLLRANEALHEEMAEHKKTERDLLGARQAADAASKAKSEFLANMSHEIRTPMNAVIGMAGLLLDTSLTSEQRDYVETIHSSGDALLSIINDILDFSKIDEGKMKLEHQPFNLEECIESSLDMVAAKAAEKSLELNYMVDEGVPLTILGDSARLRQVLANLLSNAVKFTDKGQVMISVHRGEGPDEIQFDVLDTGIGISGEDMGKLFLSFSQIDTSASRKYGGTGLGLAISKRLVELMEGEIWVESKIGRGSTFHFKIKAKNAPAQVQDLRLAGKKIMAVVNNEACLKSLVNHARSWGMHIYPVVSASEARELAKSSFDVVILDMQVPEAEELIADLQDTVPVISIAPLGQRGAGRISLTKPVKLSRLRAALRDVLLPKNQRIKKISSRAYQRDMRILLAEDNPVNQKVALLMLKRLGYRADVAANGREALMALKRQRYDAVLMDVQMPEMDGLEAAKVIKEMDPERRPKILAMTAYALEGDRERCLGAGMDGYISKPVQMKELKMALESLENSRSPREETG